MSLIPENFGVKHFTVVRKNIPILVMLGCLFSGCGGSEQRLKSKHFNFLFPEVADSIQIRQLSKILEDNYSRIGNDLGTQPANPIEVNIYSNRLKYATSTGNWSASGNIEGVSKLHFMQQAWDEKDIGKIAIHEFAHTVTLKLLLDPESTPINSKKFDEKFAKFPTWLWEGVSVYEARQFVDPKTLPFLQNDRFPSLEELNNRSKGQKIYAVGYILIEYILEKYGHAKFLELITNYGNIPAVLKIDENELMKDWYGFVKKKYLSKG
jgi:hypothetical protein